MLIIARKQAPDGSYPDVGMLGQIPLNRFKTIRAAVRYGLHNARGKWKLDRYVRTYDREPIESVEVDLGSEAVG